MPEHVLEARSDSVTREIVAAIADETDRDPENLPPLYDAVDPDALEAIVNRSPRVDREASAIEVTFDFAGCIVTVSTVDGVDVSAETPTGSTAMSL